MTRYGRRLIPQDPEGVADTPTGLAASQPTWYPDRSAILFRRSGSMLASSFWFMGLKGEKPDLLVDPPGPQFYPSWSPDQKRILMATVTSPTRDLDRAIQVINPDGTGLTTLYDVVGEIDSGPAWSPDGTRIAFESDGDPDGRNPGNDREIWIMNADGTNPVQITDNTLHDEGPAWSPDGTMLAYSSGLDNDHVDINVMTTGGVHLRTLTDYEGRDESPDWQPIPAPDTDRRCGDVGQARDIRAAGRRMPCWKARWLASRFAPGAPYRPHRFDAESEDFGGILRVVLTHRKQHRNHKLVTFLYQP